MSKGRLEEVEKAARAFVADVYPQMTYDIVEASKCLALERGTACIFHLMRVLDFGLQLLGRRLKITAVQDRTWQQILGPIHGALNAMPEKPSSAKRKKEKLAEVVTYLESVKTAWRNPVMHLKRVYTVEEAERIYRAVNDFMQHLTMLLKPRAGL